MVRVACFIVAINTMLATAMAQDSTPIKLPDGTIILYTTNTNDPSPKIEGVKLSVEEYRKLLDQTEQLRKAKANTTPVPPSECAILAGIVTRADKQIAQLSFTFRVRTTVARTTVPLGTTRTFLTSATLNGKLRPVLMATDDGLSVVLETPGEHTIELKAEAALLNRPGSRETGFELGLPKAAITTLALAKDFSAKTETANITLGVRGPDTGVKPNELKKTTHASNAITTEALPIGPVEWLEVHWPTTTRTTTQATLADANISVRISETTAEILAQIPLTDATGREWDIVLPPQTTASLTAFGETALPLTAPTSGTTWKVKVPTTGTWTLTATTTIDRKASPGAFAVGPYLVKDAVRNAGVVRVWAVPQIKPQLKLSPTTRATDTTGDEATAFTYATVPDANAPLATITPVANPGIIVIKPTYKLRQLPQGWRLRADLRISPIRLETDRIRVTVPTTWPVPEFGPSSLVETVLAEPANNGTKTYTVKLIAPRKDAFDITLEATLPHTAEIRKTDLLFPTFPQSNERDTTVTVQAMDGWDVTGTLWAKGSTTAEELASTDANPKATGNSNLAGRATLGVNRVGLTWSVFHPELNAEFKADVSELGKQWSVNQTIRFRSPFTLPKLLKLKGPPGLVGLRTNVSVTSLGAGEWSVALPADRGQDWTLNLNYALPRGAETTSVAVPLLWPEDTSNTQATVKLWAPRGSLLGSVTGPWREVPPQPSAEKDSLPRLTLLGERAKDAKAPALVLALTPNPDAASSLVFAERVMAQVWMDDAPKVRYRFAFSKWNNDTLEVEVPPGTVEYSLDGKRVDPATAGGIARIVMPEPKANRAPTVLEVRVQTVNFSVLQTLNLPVIRGVTIGTVKWVTVAPTSHVVLDVGSNAMVTQRWGWNGNVPGLIPSETPSQLEAWFNGSSPPDKQQAEPSNHIIAQGMGPIRTATLPRAAWLSMSSLLAIVLLAWVFLSRKPWVAVGLWVILGAALAYLLPHLAGAWLMAALPGLLAGGLLFTLRAIARSIARRRQMNLPAFRRSLGESSLVSPGQAMGK